MTQIIDITQSAVWDSIVKSFSYFDVYYLSGYVKAFQVHGDGRPQLLYYHSDSLKAIYVFMKRNTDIEGYYDSITPYGYGGVIFEGDTCDENLHRFWHEFANKMNEMNIVDNFVRYHPVLANGNLMKKVSNVTDLGKTIVVDLSTPELIWQNVTSKNRNVIRKAQKNGIEIHHGKDMALFEDFKRIYNDTMRKDQAEDYYFFEDGFYQSIYHDLYDNFEMFYATLDGKPIAMSVMIFANHQMHYHLSGSLREYRYLAPTNLLLYQAALWGCQQGFKTFHLGGGVGSEEDNLYRFKAAFNRNSDYRFSIGREIFDQAKYQELTQNKQEQGKSFDPDERFFPIYRS